MLRPSTKAKFTISSRTWRIRSYISPSECEPWTLGTNRGSVSGFGKIVIGGARQDYVLNRGFSRRTAYPSTGLSVQPSGVNPLDHLNWKPSRYSSSCCFCFLVSVIDVGPLLFTKATELSTNVCVRSIMSSIQSSKVVLEDWEGVLACRCPDVVYVSINKVVFELLLGGDRDLAAKVDSKFIIAVAVIQTIPSILAAFVKCSGISQIWRGMFAFDYRFDGFLLEFS